MLDSERSIDSEKNEFMTVENAGLVLLSPFLPQLFDRLQLMRDGVFTSDAAADRAVYLLEHLSGGNAQAPEYALALNKCLCGRALAAPISRGVVFTDDELAATSEMTDAVIAHWSALGNTTPEGLRTSFLRRHGILTTSPGIRHLRVESKPFDMLLDTIPWNFQVIRHPWMLAALHVEWR